MDFTLCHFSTSCIEKRSICNICKDNLVYMWYIQIVYIRFILNIYFLYCKMKIFLIHNMD